MHPPRWLLSPKGVAEIECLVSRYKQISISANPDPGILGPSPWYLSQPPGLVWISNPSRLVGVGSGPLLGYLSDPPKEEQVVPLSSSQGSLFYGFPVFPLGATREHRSPIKPGYFLIWLVLIWLDWEYLRSQRAQLGNIPNT